MGSLVLAALLILVHRGEEDPQIGGAKPPVKGPQAEGRSSAGQTSESQTAENLSPEQRLEILEGRMRQFQADPTLLAPSSRMRVYFGKGLRMETLDGSVKLRFGTRMHLDWMFAEESDRFQRNFGRVEDGVEFRRARFRFSGSLDDHVEFYMAIDFADGDSEFKNIGVTFTDLPYIGNIAVGEFREPLGQEVHQSTNHITFLERNLASALTPGRNLGVTVFDRYLDDRLSLQVGVYKDTDSNNVAEGNQGALTARVTVLPIMEDDGAHLLQLGASGSWRSPADNEVDYSARPEAHLAPHLVDIDTNPMDGIDGIRASRARLWGVEALYVNHALSVQGEIIGSHVTAKDFSNPTFYGGSVEVSWFLTGEHRAYRESRSSMGALSPHHPFRIDGGCGAWEVAARVSQLDLSDGDIRGGILTDTTLGLNWYLYDEMRIMWNWVHATPNGKGDTDLFLMRIQFNF